MQLANIDAPVAQFNALDRKVPSVSADVCDVLAQNQPALLVYLVKRVRTGESKSAVEPIPPPNGYYKIREGEAPPTSTSLVTYRRRGGDGRRR